MDNSKTSKLDEAKSLTTRERAEQAIDHTARLMQSRMPVGVEVIGQADGPYLSPEHERGVIYVSTTILFKRLYQGYAETRLVVADRYKPKEILSELEKVYQEKFQEHADFMQLWASYMQSQSRTHYPVSHFWTESMKEHGGDPYDIWDAPDLATAQKKVYDDESNEQVEELVVCYGCERKMMDVLVQVEPPLPYDWEQLHPSKCPLAFSMVANS